jgi:hypothetical protein
MRRPPFEPEPEPPPPGRFDALLDVIAPVPSAVNKVMFGGRLLALLLMVVWGGYFLMLPWRSQEIGASFLHGINLVFHEAGHVIFAPFGRFMMFLGGSLNQVLVPLIFGVVFFVKYRNAFGAAFCLAWVGQSLKDVAPYIADARIMDMPLLGEMDDEDVESRADRHDWHNLLGDLGWLQHEVTLGRAVAFVGGTLMVLACLWGALVLWRQWQRRSDFAFEEG